MAVRGDRQPVVDLTLTHFQARKITRYWPSAIRNNSHRLSLQGLPANGKLSNIIIVFINYRLFALKSIDVFNQVDEFELILPKVIIEGLQLSQQLMIMVRSLRLVGSFLQFPQTSMESRNRSTEPRTTFLPLCRLAAKVAMLDRRPSVQWATSRVTTCTNEQTVVVWQSKVSLIQSLANKRHQLLARIWLEGPIIVDLALDQGRFHAPSFYVHLFNLPKNVY